MPSFNFESIDVPAAAGTYTYIGVTGVDSAGEAVGYYGYVDGDDDGYWHGFIAEGPNGVTFDPPNSTSTDVNGITPGGELFGDYTYLNKQHGYVDNNGVVTTVDMFLANSTTVSGITASGEIYGTYADSSNGVHGFIDNNGSYSNVDVADAAATTLAGINAAGEIVGTYTDASYISHGFAIVNGITTTINAPGAYSTSVVGVSATGTVVGNFQDFSNDDHGFIDQNGVITTVDVPGATETNILGINPAGDIYGYYNDANGQHGFVGTPAPVVISAFGSTSLVEVGNSYYLDPIAGGTGPELKYGGAPVTPGEFMAGGSTWAPIGAQATSTGYEVAFRLGSTNEYSVWATDSNGNYTKNLYMPGPGNSLALEALETSFHQDLNGDGTVGIPAPIQTDTNSFGSISLIKTGGEYFLENGSTGTGPELSYQGAPVTAGEFVVGSSTYTPIGAALTATGYEVAWRLGNTDTYSVWATDSNGNYTSNLYLPGPGTNQALETLETTTRT